MSRCGECGGELQLRCVDCGTRHGGRTMTDEARDSLTAELKYKEWIAQLLYGHCYYVVRDGEVVDVLNPSEVRTEPGVGVEP